MNVRWGCFVLWAIAARGVWASEPACYRTAEAAAAQVGVRGVDGFRLEGRQLDVFSGLVWATVRSCTHPERPGLLLMAGAEASRIGTPARTEPPAMVLLAGAKVILLVNEDMVRIAIEGIAQGSGGLGDHVRVRLLTLSPGGEEQFAEGIVRGSNVVERAAR